MQLHRVWGIFYSVVEGFVKFVRKCCSEGCVNMRLWRLSVLLNSIYGVCLYMSMCYMLILGAVMCKVCMWLLGNMNLYFLGVWGVLEDIA